MEEEIEKLIQHAIVLNPNFINLSTQQQYDYLKFNLDKDLLKEEFKIYHDAKFNGWPYDSKGFIKLNG